MQHADGGDRRRHDAGHSGRPLSAWNIVAAHPVQSAPAAVLSKTKLIEGPRSFFVFQLPARGRTDCPVQAFNAKLQLVGLGVGM